jgi:phospholipid/cholesterol/gamma-HCH transport system permease protein
MNTEPINLSEGDDTADAASGLRRVLAAIGYGTLAFWRVPVTFISDAAAVILQSCRPITWRRSIRNEFMLQCYLVGAQALPFILVSGIFVGFGLVAQSFHWLNVFGSTALFGGFMSAVLVREIAPVLVGLIVIGRSGSRLLVELGSMKTEGQVHMLDAQGIDPFLYLVVPRVLAFCICMFSLAVAFVAVALLGGFLSGVLVGITQSHFLDFINRAVGSMSRETYALFTLKTVIIGFVVALLSCKTALSVSGDSARVLNIMPRGFGQSALATLVISIALTFLFS